MVDSKLLITHFQTTSEGLLKNIKGRIFQGKEDLLSALSTFTVTCKGYFENHKDKAASHQYAMKIFEHILTECKKTKLTYRQQALISLAETIDAFNKVFNNSDYSLDIFEETFPILQEIAVSQEDKSQDPTAPIEEETKKTELTEEERAEKKKLDNLRVDMKVECYNAIAACLPSSPKTQKKFLPQIFQLLCTQASELGNIGPLRIAILKALSKLISLIKSKEVIENTDLLGSSIINVLDINLSDANSTQLRSAGLQLVKSLVENKQGVYECINEDYKKQIKQRLTDLNIKFPGKHLEIERLISAL